MKSAIKPDALVSIVIPTHNRAEMLRDTLNSLLNQTWQNIEIIVVDDASSDDTPAVCLEYSQKDERIRTLRNTSAVGAAVSRNRGAEIARGEFLAFNDDDCDWAPEKLELAVQMFRSLPPQVGMLYSPIELNGKILPHHTPRHGGPQAVVLRRSAFWEVGGFDPHLPRWQDVDLWTRILCRYEARLIPQTLVRERPTQGGISTNVAALRATANILLHKYEDGRLIRGRELATLHLEFGHRLVFLRQHDLALDHFKAALTHAPWYLRARLQYGFAMLGSFPYRAAAVITMSLRDLAFRVRNPVTPFPNQQSQSDLSSDAILL